MQDHRREAALLKLKTPTGTYSTSKSTRCTKSPNNTLRGFVVNANKDVNYRGGSTLGGGSSIQESQIEVKMHGRELSKGSGSRQKKKNFLQDNINQIKIIERQASKRGLSRQHSRCLACRKPDKENIRPNHTIVGLVAESLQKQMSCKHSPHVPRLNLQGLRQARASVETASSVNKTMTSFISPQEHPLIFSGASNNTTLILPQETLDAIRQSGLRANSSCRRKKASSRGSRPQSRGSIIMKQRMSINQASRASLAGIRVSVPRRPRVAEAKRLLKQLLLSFQKQQRWGMKKVMEFVREHRMREINEEALRRLGPFASQLNSRSSELWIYNKERKRSGYGRQIGEAVEAVAKVKVLGARLLVAALSKGMRGRFGEFRRASRKLKNRSEYERLWRKY